MRGKQEREEYTNRLHWGLGNKGERVRRAKIRWRATESKERRLV